MSTRGAYGFVQDGKYKVTYNQSDSYPSGLGQEVVNFVKSVVESEALDTLKERVKAVKLVDESKPATKAEIKRYEKFYQNVSSGAKTEWYCLLRDLQGVSLLEHILSGEVEHMIDSSEFVKDSLFCEWAYIIDLNRNTFDVYQGYQHDPQEGNVFGVEAGEGGYYPVKLIASFPLTNIPDDWQKQVEQAGEKDDEVNKALDVLAEEDFTEEPKKKKKK